MPITKLHIGAGAIALGAVLAIPGAASAQNATRQVTFNTDVSPIFQA